MRVCAAFPVCIVMLLYSCGGGSDRNSLIPAEQSGPGRITGMLKAYAPEVKASGVNRTSMAQLESRWPLGLFPIGSNEPLRTWPSDAPSTLTYREDNVYAISFAFVDIPLGTYEPAFYTSEPSYIGLDLDACSTSTTTRQSASALRYTRELSFSPISVTEESPSADGVVLEWEPFGSTSLLNGTINGQIAVTGIPGPLCTFTLDRAQLGQVSRGAWLGYELDTSLMQMARCGFQISWLPEGEYDLHFNNLEEKYPYYADEFLSERGRLIISEDQPKIEGILYKALCHGQTDTGSPGSGGVYDGGYINIELEYPADRRWRGDLLFAISPENYDYSIYYYRTGTASAHTFYGLANTRKYNVIVYACGPELDQYVVLAQPTTLVKMVPPELEEGVTYSASMKRWRAEVSLAANLSTSDLCKTWVADYWLDPYANRN